MVEFSPKKLCILFNAVNLHQWNYSLLVNQREEKGNDQDWQVYDTGPVCRWLLRETLNSPITFTGRIVPLVTAHENCDPAGVVPAQRVETEQVDEKGDRAKTIRLQVETSHRTNYMVP